MLAFVTELAQPWCGSGQQDDFECKPQASCGSCYSLEETESIRFCSRTGKLISCLVTEKEASTERQFNKYGYIYNMSDGSEPADSCVLAQALCPAGGFVLLHSHALLDTYSLRPRLLGWGTFGDVAIAVHNETGALRAVKTINKTWLRRAYLHMQEGEVNTFVRREVEVLRKLDHPNIVRLYEAFDDPSNFQMILELCQGGTLTSHIEPQQDRLLESEASGIFRQMLAAVQHLHSHGFVHRDLKPDNFIFAKMDQEGVYVSYEVMCLKLIDFGLARRLGVDTGLHNSRKMGTKNFKPPELGAGQAIVELADRIDMWALGVILFMIFAAELPPRDASETLKDQYAIGASSLGQISAFAVDLLSNLLSKEPLWRPTALTAMRHAWCSGGPGKCVQNLCAPEEFEVVVDEYALSPKLRRLALLVVAYVLDDHDIEFASVRKHFQAFEFECEGNITRESIKSVCAAGGAISILARVLRNRFEYLNADDSDTITWTKFLAIFIKVHAPTSLDAGEFSIDVPMIVVPEEMCRRAFHLLSDGTDKISATTIGELFAPVRSGRVMNYEMGPRKPNKFEGFSQSMGRDQMVREVCPNGCLHFDDFMRMLGNIQNPVTSEEMFPKTPRAAGAEEEIQNLGSYTEITGLWSCEELPQVHASRVPDESDVKDQKFVPPLYDDEFRAAYKTSL